MNLVANYLQEDKAPSEFYIKACQTAFRRARIDWELIKEENGVKIYQLRPRGVLKPHWDKNKSFFKVSVKPESIVLTEAFKGGFNKTVLKFKKGKIRLYKVTKRQQSTEFKGLSYNSISKIRRFICASLHSKKSEYEKAINLCFKKLEHEIYLLAKRCNVRYIKSKSIEDNYIRLNYPVFSELLSLEDNVYLRNYDLMKFLNKATKEKVIKYLTKSNSKKITKLFYQSLSKGCFSTKCFLSYLLKDFVTLDDLQKIWEKDRIPSIVIYHINKTTRNLYRSIFSRMNRKSLMRDLLGEEYLHISDVSMLEERAKTLGFRVPEKISNLEAYHTELAEYINYSRHPDFEVPLNDLAKELDDQVFDNYQFAIPKTNREYMDWGKKLKNCIGGYGYRVLEKHCIVLGVKKDGELKYALQISPEKEIIQFYGSANTAPKPEDSEKILEKLEEFGIGKIFKSEYLNIFPDQAVRAEEIIEAQI